MTIAHQGTEFASGVFNITPSDAAELSDQTRAIRVTVGGSVRIKTPYNQTVTCDFTSGETRAIAATWVYATGTTATGIEGMY